MSLLFRCLVKSDGSHLGLGRGLTVAVIEEAIQVELVHLYTVIAGTVNLGHGQAVEDVLVDHCHEVAIPVVTLRALSGLLVFGNHKVTLVVVELQAHKVVPARDDHAGAVTRGMECGTRVGNAVHLILDGVTVLVLGHCIDRLSHVERVLVLIIEQVAIDVIELDVRGLELSAVAVLVDEIHGVGLRHVRARHLVQRRFPSERHIVVMVAGAVIRIGCVANECCHSIQGNPVDTNLGGIGRVIDSIVSRPSRIIGT